MTWLAYTIIILGSSTLWGIINGWLLYFYLPPQGNPLVPVALFSIFIIISRAINILIGLPIGYLSDRTRSRWGRRLPYVMGGALFLPFFFILLWTPPEAHESIWNLLYVSLALIAFNIAYEVHQTPYDSLLPELAIGEKERVAISSWKSGFQLGGYILAGFAGPLIEALGYAHAMWIFAAVAAPFLILPGFFLRRRVNLAAQPVEQISFIEGLRMTFSNRAFQVFALSWGLMWTATTFILESLPYIVTEICHLSEADTVYFYFPAIAVSLASFPAVTWLSRRYGMKAVYRGSLLAGAITLPGLMIIGNWIPIPLLAQGIIWIVIQSAGLAGAQVLPSAIAAEITDDDERRTGQRREGSFYSAWGLIGQVASGLATAAIPLFLLLGRSQFDPQGPLGVRLLGLAGGGLLLASFWVFRRYKLM